LTFIVLTEVNIKTTLLYEEASCSLVDSTMTLVHPVVSFMSCVWRWRLYISAKW